MDKTQIKRSVRSALWCSSRIALSFKVPLVLTIRLCRYTDNFLYPGYKYPELPYLQLLKVPNHLANYGMYEI